MTEEKLNNIYSDNKKLIQEIILYVLKTYNISNNLLVTNRNYTKALLREVKSNNLKLKALRIKRKALEDDLHSYEAAFVLGDNYDAVGAGHNNGLIPNTAEIRMLKKRDLREKLQKIILEICELTISLEANNDRIKRFIDLIPRDSIKTIMNLSYIECLTNIEIATELNYSIDTVNNSIWRGINELTDILTYAAGKQA